MKLYKHQQEFLDSNKDKAIISADVGTGKSLMAIMYIKARPQVNFILVCPKNIVEKWEKDLQEHNVKTTVVSKENFKKTNLKSFTGVVVDECHFFQSPLKARKRSQMTETLYNFIRNQKIDYILLMSGTVYGNDPAGIHTLLSYIDKAPDWKKYQFETYNLVTRPFSPHAFWERKKNWKKVAVQYADQYLFKAKIEDIVDYPKETENTYEIKTELLKPNEVVCETLVEEFHLKSRRESDIEKINWVKDYIKDKAKVVLACRYLSVIEKFKNELEKIRTVYVLTGETKNPAEIIQQANEDPECILIVNPQVSAGWEASSFQYMVFINLPFSVRDFVQCKGRIRRINKPQNCFYTYLIGGIYDKRVYKSIKELNQDFTI